LRASGDDAQALAHLAQALRLNPKNDEAAAMASTMLTQTSWPILVADPLRHSAALHSAEFSPDGRRAVTASDDDTARLWDTATGKPIGEPISFLLNDRPIGSHWPCEDRETVMENISTRGYAALARF
jgi:WD40 repeat protein